MEQYKGKVNKIDQLRISATEWLINRVEPVAGETHVSLTTMRPNQPVELGSNAPLSEKVANYLTKRPRTL